MACGKMQEMEESGSGRLRRGDERPSQRQDERGKRKFKSPRCPDPVGVDATGTRGTRRAYLKTIPVTSSMKLEALTIPGLYFVGWPHLFRRSRASSRVVLWFLSSTLTPSAASSKTLSFM